MQADIEMKDETGQSKEDTKPTEDEKYIKYKMNFIQTVMKVPYQKMF